MKTTQVAKCQRVLPPYLREPKGSYRFQNILSEDYKAAPGTRSTLSLVLPSSHTAPGWFPYSEYTYPAQSPCVNCPGLRGLCFLPQTCHLAGDISASLDRPQCLPSSLKEGQDEYSKSRHGQVAFVSNAK